MKRIRIRVPRPVWELLSVAFGVSIALLANDYNDLRKNRILKEKALEGIYQEILTNRVLVEASLLKHDEFLSKIETEPETLVLQLNTAPIINSAWNAIKNSGLIHLMDFELILLLSEINSLYDDYYHQKFLADQALYFIRFLPTSFESKVEMLEGWESAFEDFSNSERTLINKYQKVIELIDPNIN